MKRLLKILQHLLFAILVLVAVYFSLALLLSYLPASPGEKHCRENRQIFVSTNGVHLFMGIPIDYFEASFLAKLQYPEDTRYLYLGWGEKTFYLHTPSWDDLTLPVAAKAMLIPSESAMHVMYFRSQHSSWQEVPLCDEQLQPVLHFVTSSFKESSGSFAPLQPRGYGPNSYFYEARGRYSCLYTSNTWVNDALKKAGVQTAVWTPFDFGVLWHLEKENQTATSAAGK